MNHAEKEPVEASVLQFSASLTPKKEVVGIRYKCYTFWYIFRGRVDITSYLRLVFYGLRLPFEGIFGDIWRLHLLRVYIYIYIYMRLVTFAIHLRLLLWLNLRLLLWLYLRLSVECVPLRLYFRSRPEKSSSQKSHSAWQSHRHPCARGSGTFYRHCNYSTAI